MKTHFAAALLAFGLFAGTVHAAPPSEASIDKLLTATKVESIIDTMRGQFGTQIKETTHRSFNTDERTPREMAIINQFSDKATALLLEEFNWKTLKPLYVKVYAETFTQQEIDGLVAFYKTPAGQAYVAKMPAVMQKSSQLVMSRIGPLTQKVQDMAREAADKLAALPKEEAPKAETKTEEKKAGESK